MNYWISAISFLIILGFFSIPAVQATSISIEVEKKIYNYGDFLVFTVEVSEVTGDFAILHIIDEIGKSSSAIPIQITEPKMVIPSPFPFESIIYPQGRYTLDIEYSGSSDTAEFELIDSGNIVIPFWIKELAYDWKNEKITEKNYALGIRHLIKEKIIDVQENLSENNEVKIPNWFKDTTSWWAEGMIPDNDYGKALEFLLKKRIIIV